ncbi:mucin-5AC [Rhipicephalus sanguineus]|uniref:mucin-5AC n=1 Tax=Rhipicephalus sanguineus TaxID=34632 RepID=UPI00189631BE|nr:mucin-5AC [Rhipicephalus sanguineus]
MSGFERPPGPSHRAPTDSSPLLPQPMGPRQRSARGAPAPLQPTTSPLQHDHVGPSALLAALQEHIAILHQHLDDAEEGLDSCEPEEYEDLEKALFQVSSMISQMEYTEDLLEEKKLNLTNELRTLEEENMYLNDALMRERAKRLDEIDPTFSGQSSAAPCSPNQLFPGRASADEDGGDAFGDITSPTSASNLPPSSEPSACVEKSNEILADRPGIMDPESQPTSAKRGRLSQAATPNSIPPEHIINENASTSSASTASIMASGLEPTSTAGQSIMDPEMRPPSPKRGRLSTAATPSSMPPERIITEASASTTFTSTALLMALEPELTSAADQGIIDPEMSPPSPKRGRLSTEATPGSMHPERIATKDSPSTSSASKAKVVASGLQLISAVGQDMMDPQMRPDGAKRGRLSPAATPSSMPPECIITEDNVSTSSASTAAAMASEFESHRPRANPAPKMLPIQLIQVPDEVDINDIEQIAEALGIRNNAQAWNDLIIMEDLREFFG